MFTNLLELIKTMPDEQRCREYIAEQRWGKGNVVCPHCGHNRAYVTDKGKGYKCASKECYKKFSVTVGTIMEASKLPLIKWLTAIYLVSAHKKGISSYQLGRDLSIAQKNSWFMLHRIREMLRIKTHTKLDNIVEIDEVYIGGKVSNMSKTKRKKLRDEGKTYGTKTMIMGMIERGGNLKLVTVAGTNNTQAIQPTVKEHVDTDAVVITDSLTSYNGLDKVYAAHEVVNHTGHEYVRDKVFHTNSIEGAFSMLKRSLYGIYHRASPKHLSRYCDETMFRYNLRAMNDAARFGYTVSQLEGRLTYKQLIEKEEQPVKILLPRNTPDLSKKGKHNQIIIQYKDGLPIAEYKGIRTASRATGIDSSLIRAVLSGDMISTHGYQWKYL